LTYKLHFWYAGVSSEYLGQVRTSTSLVKGHGHKSKKPCLCVSVIFVNENENKNGEKRENNEFVNEN